MKYQQLKNGEKFKKGDICLNKIYLRIVGKSTYISLCRSLNDIFMPSNSRYWVGGDVVYQHEFAFRKARNQ